VAGVRSVVMLAQLYVLFSFFELTVLWRLLGKVRAQHGVLAQQATCERNLLPALIAANLMSTLSTNFDKILAYSALNLRVLGEYTFAAQIAALLNLFANSAVAAFSPRFRELYIHRDYGQIRRFFMLLSALNNFMVLAAAVLFLTNGEFFLSVFKGHIDRAALLGTFAILAGAALVSSNLWFPGAIATSTGKPRFSVFTNIGFIAVYLCAFLILRGRFHDSVFALSMLCSAFVTTTAGLVYFKLRVLDFSLLRYGLVAVALPVLIVGVTYAIPALLIKSHFGGVLPGLVFAAAWLGALLPVAFRGRHLLALGRQYAD
jgi:O-antigen/teichoic acid export membrane protein